MGGDTNSKTSSSKSFGQKEKWRKKEPRSPVLGTRKSRHQVSSSTFGQHEVLHGHFHKRGIPTSLPNSTPRPPNQHKLMQFELRTAPGHAGRKIRSLYHPPCNKLMPININREDNILLVPRPQVIIPHIPGARTSPRNTPSPRSEDRNPG